MQDFEVAAATFVGSEHSRPFLRTNNQDGYAHIAQESSIVAVVCDGCGSSPSTEVGAKIGARLVAEAINKRLHRSLFPFGSGIDPVKLLEGVRKDVLARIHVLAEDMGGNYSSTLYEYFLFTIVGVLITPKTTWCFNIGDGVFAVNGQICELGPFPGNAPPYIVYDLVDVEISKEVLRFQVHDPINTADLNSVLIATDGAVEFIRVQDNNLPGKTEPLGPISQFWERDIYFSNPDKIRRRLALANQTAVTKNLETNSPQEESPLLPDDTTLVVVRRRKIQGED